jgi:hypothetical protein
MRLRFDELENGVTLSTEISDDEVGTVNRVNNAVEHVPQFIEENKASLEGLTAQRETICEALDKPFEYGLELERGEVGSRAEHLSVAELKWQTLDREIADQSKKLESAKKRFATMEGKAKSMEGVVASKKKLDALQPEPGMLGTIKGLTLEDVQSLKKTAIEYYLLTEKVKELSVKYVNPKSKVPSEAEKLETAKKLAGIRQLEQETARLQGVLQAYGTDLNGRGISSNYIHDPIGR